MKTPRIAVLALQGAFIEHRRMLENLGADVFEIRKETDLERSCHALVLPGGESTAQSKLLRELNLFDTLKRRIDSGLPVLATCAGIILLAEKLADDPVTHFAALPVTVRRNAYGRQSESFYRTGKFGNLSDIPMPFIRAPQITNCRKDVEILTEFDGVPAAVKFRNQLAMTFHPEITSCDLIHKFFLESIVIPTIKN